MNQPDPPIPESTPYNPDLNPLPPPPLYVAPPKDSKSHMWVLAAAVLLFATVVMIVVIIIVATFWLASPKEEFTPVGSTFGQTMVLDSRT